MNPPPFSLRVSGSRRAVVNKIPANSVKQTEIEFGIKLPICFNVGLLESIRSVQSELVFLLSLEDLDLIKAMISRANTHVAL